MVSNQCLDWAVPVVRLAFALAGGSLRKSAMLLPYENRFEEKNGNQGDFQFIGSQGVACRKPLFLAGVEWLVSR